jgi:hypothetical protein
LITTRSKSMTATAERHGAPQLLRVPYHSTATGAEREFLLYLPAGYADEPARRWPGRANCSLLDNGMQ